MGRPLFAGRGKLTLTPDIKINWEGEKFTRRFFVKGKEVLK